MKRSNFGSKKAKADKEYTVSAETGLLNFLLETLSGYSRNNVKSLLTHKEVLVDGRAVTQYDHILRPGQTVRIVRSINRGGSSKKIPDILFEDDDMIAINKPSGLLSIATDEEKEVTAYHMLMEYMKMQHHKGRVLIVHRLDRDTSGILVFAKNERMKLALQDNWANLVTERGYVAVVEGKLDKKSGTITSWLRQTETLLVYSSREEGDGLKAITEYKVIKENDDYSMLDIRLQTGRKNQIRVHMKELGHCVVGDKKYGAALNPLNRLGLHACLLEFKHPFSGEVLRFQVPAPKSFDSLFRGN